MENYTLEQAIATLEAINEQSLTSSIFSRQDVIRILKSIVVPEVKVTEYQALPEDYVDRLIDELVDSIDSDDAIEKDTADFELSYDNRIELNSVDLDTYRIKRNMMNAYDNIMSGINADIAYEKEREQERIAFEEAQKEQSEEVSTEEQENGQSNNNETTENNECQ
jgi:hypothetical protein